jgi:acylphosphatase
MAEKCIKAIVSGKVQRVFYRYNTQQKALELQLLGWAKNLENGDVEVVACGNAKDIQQLLDWLWQGPKAAEVKNVVWEEVPLQKFEGFKVL